MAAGDRSKEGKQDASATHRDIDGRGAVGAVCVLEPFILN